MKSEKEIQAAIEQCKIAQKKWDVKKCPIWPDEEGLICHDCTCRSALRWVLGIKEE